MTADISRQTYPFSLPDLPYAYDALEPHLDEQTLRIHHQEHHGAYVKKLNEALAAEPPLHGKTLDELLRGAAQLPEKIRTAVKNNGGGHFNHDLFWRSMTPNSRAPGGAFALALTREFGSFDAFRTRFNDIAGKHFASGWVALTVANAAKKLAIVDLKDHEVLHEGAVVLIIDVWEHAYYLKYQSRRPDFITAFWNVVDWEETESRFTCGVVEARV